MVSCKGSHGELMIDCHRMSASTMPFEFLSSIMQLLYWGERAHAGQLTSLRLARKMMLVTDSKQLALGASESRASGTGHRAPSADYGAAHAHRAHSPLPPLRALTSHVEHAEDQARDLKPCLRDTCRFRAHAQNVVGRRSVSRVEQPIEVGIEAE